MHETTTLAQTLKAAIIFYVHIHFLNVAVCVCLTIGYVHKVYVGSAMRHNIGIIGSEVAVSTHYCVGIILCMMLWLYHKPSILLLKYFKKSGYE